jgi:hypothetical protein
MGRINCGDGDGGEPVQSPSGRSSFRRPVSCVGCQRAGRCTLTPTAVSRTEIQAGPCVNPRRSKILLIQQSFWLLVRP